MTDSFAPLIGRLADPRPLTWLFVGDSITHGIWHTAGGRSYVEHVQEIVRGDRWRIHDTFINAAVSGTNILETLDDFELRVERHHADFVFTLIGTNDSATDREIPVPQFRAGLDEFTTRVQGTGAQLILQTPPPVSPRLDPRRAGLPEYADAIRSVAGEHRVPPHRSRTRLAGRHSGYGGHRVGVVVGRDPPQRSRARGHGLARARSARPRRRHHVPPTRGASHG